jgi:hypothetical protein
VLPGCLVLLLEWLKNLMDRLARGRGCGEGLVQLLEGRMRGWKRFLDEPSAQPGIMIHEPP